MHETLHSCRDVSDTEMINLKLAACGKAYAPPMKPLPFVSKDASKQLKGRRDAFYEEAGGFVSTLIYDGDQAEVGNMVDGPAVIELKTTTIVVQPRPTLGMTSHMTVSS